jgi:hypothetical protein
MFKHFIDIILFALFIYILFKLFKQQISIIELVNKVNRIESSINTNNKFDCNKIIDNLLNK